MAARVERTDRLQNLFPILGMDDGFLWRQVCGAGQVIVERDGFFFRLPMVDGKVAGNRK